MKSVQRGKLPASMALSRSRPLLSRSLATRASASASVRFWIPCCVRKWNLTQTRSLAALIIEKVWLAKRGMWRELFGMPRSGVPIDLMVDVGEAQWVAKVEYRRVVADNVLVAFLVVELHRGAAYVTLGVRRAAFARDTGEAQEERRLLADCAEDLRPREARDIV